MDRELAEFRSWTEMQRRRTTAGGVRFPEQRQAWAASYARRRLSGGAGLRAAASELTVSEPTLRRWLADAERAAPGPLGGKLVAVTVRQAPAPTVMTATPAALTRRLTVVTAGGLRVEGLDVDDAVALVRALG